MVLVTFCSIPSFAGNLNLTYEQVVTDRYGNELGYRTYKVNSLDELPLGSPWRSYLNTKLQSGKTIYEYASSISKSLTKDFNLTISDRDNNSYSCKNSDGSYQLNIYGYVNDFATDSSKSFLFLHEFGHVVMLNSYPRSYDFGNLDYGSDSRHYLDEVLPNHNTAWVEGWANGFAAANNNGMVFSYDLKRSDSLEFLKGKSFDEMCRNELFVAKTLYDSFKDIEGGQAAAYDVFARTAPHYSLYDFCQKYVKLYPQNQVALAKILVDNSYGSVTLRELLAYINGGSNTVSRELYNYLSSSGMLNGTASNNYASNTNTSSSKPSLWSRITNFFKKLFGKGDNTEVANSPNGATGSSVTFGDEAIYNHYTDGTIAISSSVAAPVSAPSVNPVAPMYNDGVTLENAIETAQIEYNRYYEEYNQLVSSPNPDRQKLIEVSAKMNEAKNKLDKLKGNK
jgi:hypothetical protein